MNYILETKCLTQQFCYFLDYCPKHWSKNPISGSIEKFFWLWSFRLQQPCFLLSFFPAAILNQSNNFCRNFRQSSESYNALEIKPCGLGSRIRDMEAECYNWSPLLVNTQHLDCFLFLLVSRTGTVGWTENWVCALYNILCL